MKGLILWPQPHHTRNFHYLLVRPTDKQDPYQGLCLAGINILGLQREPSCNYWILQERNTSQGKVIGVIK